MKILAILLTAACMKLSAEGFGQGITLSVSNSPLEKVFKAIEKQSDYRFVYTKEEMESARPVSIDVKDVHIEAFLELCFRNQPLTYTIEDKIIIVQPKEEKKTAQAVIPFHDVKGRVVNAVGEPVAGATVTVKGTNKITTTDEKGEFFLAGIMENDVLVISGAEIQPTEISIKGQSVLTITISQKVSELDATIIKGYYTTSKRLNTGNVSKISAENISKQPVNNPLQALQGRVPGLFITQSTGVPGGSYKIQIRGQNSLRPTANNPLFIVDGVPFISTPLGVGAIIGSGGSPLTNINPTDIESIEVLKDADATAIYGSRGSNGVILITTKKGKPGKSKIDINVYTGIGKITSKMDMLNTRQYLDMRYEAFKNDGIVLTQTTPRSNDLTKWDTTRYTDWQKVLIGGNAKITNAQVSLSGGNLNTQFLIGGAYSRETTVFPGNFADQKGSVHFNITNISDNGKFKIILIGSFLRDNNNLLQLDFTKQAITLTPNAPEIYARDGSLNWENSTWTNPFSNLQFKYFGNTENLISNATFSYELLKGLNLKTNMGYSKLQMEEISTTPASSFDPALNITTGNSGFANNSIKTWIIEPLVEYQKVLWKGKFNALIGTTFQEDIRQAELIFATGYTNDALLKDIKSAANISIQNTNYTKYRYQAVFSRLSYNWQEKYLINLTSRRDGSSRFGPENQFANFGAVGGGWIFSNERFIQKKINLLSFGKIRISYGSTGSDQITDYGFLDLWRSTTYPYFGNQGLFATNLFNPNFSWETNKKFETGLELGFIKDRILFSGVYYRNRSGNQLVGYPLPRTTGFSSIQENFPATVQNSGIEIELNSNNLKDKSFSWKTSFNITFPRNKLIAYPDLARSSYAGTYVIGKPLSIVNNPHFTGVDPQTGLYTFQDLNGNGIGTDYPDDYQPIKKRDQSFYGGVQNVLEYKGWQLNIFFQFVKQTGGNFWNNNFNPPGMRTNQPTMVLNRWQKPGDNANFQKFSQNFGAVYNSYTNLVFSDYKISDASFIRLKNLSLSYQFPTALKKKLNLQNARLYVQGQNLFTITNYLGLDPETQATSVLPPLQVITVGIQVIL